MIFIIENENQSELTFFIYKLLLSLLNIGKIYVYFHRNITITLFLIISHNFIKIYLQLKGFQNNR